MAKYDYLISHVPKKFIYTAHTLSRDRMVRQVQGNFEREVETFVEAVIDFTLPQRLKLYRESRGKDEVCVQFREYCKAGWPEKALLSPTHSVHEREKCLNRVQGLLLFDCRIVVPKSLQQETLHEVHTGHLGIEKCKKHPTISVRWPGVTQQMT